MNFKTLKNFKLEICIGVLLVVVFVVILILIFFSSPDINCVYKNTDLISINDLNKELDTGDLLFLTGENYSSKTIRWFTKSYWSHVGMVIREPGNKGNNLYIWECDNNFNGSSGTHYIPLQTKFAKNKNTIGAYRKVKNLDIPIKRIKNFILNNLDKSLQTRPYSYLLSKVRPGLIYNLSINKNKWYCSELVVRTFQDLGILSNEIDPRSVSPGDLFKFSKIAFNNGAYFENPIYFRY